MENTLVLQSFISFSKNWYFTIFRYFSNLRDFLRIFRSVCVLTAWTVDYPVIIASPYPVTVYKLLSFHISFIFLIQLGTYVKWIVVTFSVCVITLLPTGGSIIIH